LAAGANRGVAGQEAHHRCNRFRLAQSAYRNLREQDVALVQIVFAVKGFKISFLPFIPSVPARCPECSFVAINGSIVGRLFHR
jgi:hypothetical protein